MHMESQLVRTKPSELLSVKHDINGRSCLALVKYCSVCVYIYLKNTLRVECAVYLYVQSILMEFLCFKVYVYVCDLCRKASALSKVYF